jgi:hypothetical protein
MMGAMDNSLEHPSLPNLIIKAAPYQMSAVGVHIIHRP